MLNCSFDQAAGLSTLQLLPPTRVLPVVQNTEDNCSLELMRRLEQALRCMGLPVAVVEGTQGLRVRDGRHGLAQLLAHWLKGVPRGSIVLMHAPLEALAVLLANSSMRPLVALNERPGTLVQAYNAVKVLWQLAHLSVVVLDIACGSASSGLARARRRRALHANCERHLGQVPAIWSLGYDQSMVAGQGQTEAYCALKVLDTALLLEERASSLQVHGPYWPRSSPASDQIVGVADVHGQRYA